MRPMHVVVPVACAVLSSVCVGVLAQPAAGAGAGKWPEKPIRAIVAFAPGGGTDVVARLLAPRMSEDLGQSVVLDNRPGAGGTIGSELAVRANPDGYTQLFIPSSYASSAALYKLNFDPIKGITPINLIGIGPLVLLVNPTSKVTTLKELIDYARANPGAVSFGSSGIGGTPHLSGELLQQLTGIKLGHVPYKGDGPAMADLMGGHIQAAFAAGASSVPQIRAGRLRGLGVTTPKRATAAPDLPAMGETVPGFSSSTWYGLVGPVGLSKEVVTRLSQTMVRVLERPDVQERLRADVVEPTPSTTPEEFARFIATEIALWTKVIKAGNVKID
ncbi:MAG: tripartite tricarboxylate transporter substrate binding protein [Proteobacteria bacterium]|nr:tripartite tricarboxylate transporter substrate binding protein [Burkholderiales bacterium]